MTSVLAVLELPGAPPPPVPTSIDAGQAWLMMTLVWPMLAVMAIVSSAWRIRRGMPVTKTVLVSWLGYVAVTAGYSGVVALLLSMGARAAESSETKRELTHRSSEVFLTVAGASATVIVVAVLASVAVVGWQREERPATEQQPTPHHPATTEEGAERL